MTTVQPSRHRARSGAQGWGHEPHPSGPIAVDPLTTPIPRAALDAAAARYRPIGPAAPFTPVPAGPPVTAARHRRWPWVVAGFLLLIVVIGSANGTTPPAAPVAPAAALPAAPASVPAAAPAAVTLPADLVGRNAQIVSGQLTALGLTNVSYASRDADDTVVVLLQNWTVTGIEPGAGTSVAPGDAVVVTVTKDAGTSGSAAAPAAAAAATPASTGPATSFSDGTHVVGQDIEAGTYKTAGPTSESFGSCYWARLSDTTGEFDAIIANGLPTGQATVTVRPGDAAFETTGCETWTKVD